jgi:hypothetical protein
MLSILERLVVLVAFITALEVGVFCVYGTGSSFTEKERAALGEQIWVETGSGGVPNAIFDDPGWQEFFEKQKMADVAAAMKREAEERAKGKPGKGGDRSGRKGSGPAREGDPPGEKQASYMTQDWLTASDSRWEHRRIPMAVRDAELPDLNSAVRVLQGASAEQVQLDDGRQAFQVTGIQQGSLIEKGGFQQGDILLSVNGHPVEGPQDGMKLYGELKNETRFVVEVLRNGRQVTLLYELE